MHLGALHGFPIANDYHSTPSTNTNTKQTVARISKSTSLIQASILNMLISKVVLHGVKLFQLVMTMRTVTVMAPTALAQLLVKSMVLQSKPIL